MMIYSLRGTLTVKEPGFAVIECGGVGYGCRTSYNTLSALGAVGSEAVMYTYLYVREDVVELFGFATLRELSCFRLLISVSGVGPKAASTILSDVSPEQLHFLWLRATARLSPKSRASEQKRLRESSLN